MPVYTKPDLHIRLYTFLNRLKCIMNINEQTRHPKKGMAGGEQIRISLFTGKEDNGNTCSFIMEHSYSAKEDFNWIKKAVEDQTYDKKQRDSLSHL